MLNKQVTKTRVKLYKHKKLWVAMGITTTLLAVGVSQAPVAQAATTTVTTTSVATKATSATSQATTTVSGQAAATSTQSSAASASTSADSQSSSQAPASTATSASSTASQATSTEPRASQAPASTATSAASQAPKSQVTSTATSQATTTSQAPATSQAAAPTATLASSKAALTKAADQTTPSDETVVTIADTNLSNAVKKGLGLSTDSPITVGAIRNYKLGNWLQISTDTTPITTLTGIEGLQYLPSKYKLDLTLRIANNAMTSIDLSPLASLSLYRLTVEATALSYVNLQPLTEIDPSSISFIDLNDNAGSYQGHQFGMTNAQLVQLSPWITAIGNNNLSNNYIGLSNNSLSDFSSLSGITKSGVFIAAVGQMIVRRSDAANPINVVENQTATFTGTTITGVQGEAIGDTFGYSFNNVAQRKQQITMLGNNQYQISDIQQISNVPGFIVYGNLGVPYSDGWQADRYIDVTYNNGVELRADAMIYQQVNFQAHPTVTVKYVDQNAQPIATLPDQVIDGVNLGDAFDLSSYLNVDNYLTYATNGPVTGTFGQNPQTLYIMLLPKTAAGTVTVNYVDADQKVLGTTTATYPNGQYVGLSYQTTAKTFAGYTYSHMDPTGLAANGTLTAVNGVVTYVYTKDPVAQGSVIVNYLDDITGETLATDTLTGDQGTTSDYTTAEKIAAYVAGGYQLVQDDWPTTGATYTATPTTYIVHLQHGQEAVTAADQLQKVVTRTIQFVDQAGKTLAPDQQSTVIFTRTGQLDTVTQLVTYSAWQSDNDQFAAVTVPTITGYTADQTQLPAVTVTPTSADVTNVVTYTLKPTDPDSGDNGGSTVTDPDNGNNGGATVTDPDNGNNGGTTVTDPDNGDNGETTVTVPDDGNNNETTVTTPTTDAEDDHLNIQVPATSTPKDDGVLTDDGQADTIQVTNQPTDVDSGQPAKGKTVMTAKSTTLQSAPVMTTTTMMRTPVVTAVKVTPTTHTAAKLPQTNEQSDKNVAWTGLGLLMTGLMTVLGFSTKRQRKF
ncbi:mucin-binding protein [Lactiplantibacillus mudanjiangensis]|uniref:Gram-positive cocci surface proteins LPxTG domain-containing protein n=1 Tax=Lactiplantibacillus mudanjiangensis TaxID=1296538 RepID=A0A660E3F1_9LACO|nr:MucBP domain-containing protein [Lactiplantibacillus mudanjiangensis]VDG23217.1 hypothetical protein [Lactobacillus sp. CBA3606] [Lactiplantibacillus mudanjiangensis]VDG29857.1 hypothetical protein [Lactobacillus sp. CBA3606] [Lactiplantibacillus mudanjiangensis]